MMYFCIGRRLGRSFLEQLHRVLATVVLPADDIEAGRVGEQVEAIAGAEGGYAVAGMAVEGNGEGEFLRTVGAEVKAAGVGVIGQRIVLLEGVDGCFHDLACLYEIPKAVGRGAVAFVAVVAEYGRTVVGTTLSQVGCMLAPSADDVVGIVELPLEVPKLAGVGRVGLCRIQVPSRLCLGGGSTFPLDEILILYIHVDDFSLQGE